MGPGLNRATPLALATLLLAGCGDAPAATSPFEDIEPAAARALNDPLMTDPDLVAINEASSALTGSNDHSLPLMIDTPEAVREAQDRAIALLGGSGSVPPLPAPGPLEEETQVSPLVMLDEVAARLAGAERCLASARYSAAWAARLPDAVPIFPRGATIEAMGSDAPGCALRAVRFRSPVPAEDLARFYFGKSREAGYRANYAANDESWQVTGQTGAARFLVRGRPSLLGGQEVDVITLR
ncbi:MAG: hypothetical protein ACK4GD_02250 [Sphingomonadaceae bacterium]